MSCSKCNQAWDIVQKGALGMAKVAMGVEKTDDAKIKQRLMKCQQCAHLKRVHKDIAVHADIGLADTCQVCGCFIRAKVRLQNEKCPDGKW